MHLFQNYLYQKNSQKWMDPITVFTRHTWLLLDGGRGWGQRYCSWEIQEILILTTQEFNGVQYWKSHGEQISIGTLLNDLFSFNTELSLLLVFYYRDVVNRHTAGSFLKCLGSVCHPDLPIVHCWHSSLTLKHWADHTWLIVLTFSVTRATLNLENQKAMSAKHSQDRDSHFTQRISHLYRM